MRALHLAASAAVACALATSARSETVVVIRPGVACASASALAALTLPDGSSRSARPGPRPKYLAIASRGGCVPLRLGVQMTTMAIRKLTDIVAYDSGDGRGMRAFYIPRIDLETLAGAPSSSESARSGAGSPL